MAAVASSLCCVLPIIFALTGAGVLGASAFFAEWRPYFLSVTFAFLSAGFYMAYRRPRETCEPGAACARPAVNRSGRIGLWVATTVVLVFATFPYYSEAVANLAFSMKGRPPAASQTAPGVVRVSFAVEGMYCPACAKAVESKLKTVPGVRQATVSYERGRAEVEYDDTKVSVEQLVQAVQATGYRARPR